MVPEYIICVKRLVVRYGLYRLRNAYYANHHAELSIVSEIQDSPDFLIVWKTTKTVKMILHVPYWHNYPDFAIFIRAHLPGFD